MTYYHGDIVEYFDILKDSTIQKHVLVHGCNCVGKYNSGIAKQIREQYPKAYEEYLKYVKNINSGNLIGNINPVSIGDTGIVINAFTQQLYGRDPNVVYVNYRALEHAIKLIANEYKDSMILLPRIGAGLANGDWNTIKDIIKNEFKNNSYMVFIK